MQHSLNFDNLDGKLAQDEAEHRHAESKLTIEDNIEQEPNVKIVESTAGNKGGTSTKKLAD
ncbi:MAG TPA: hypothetical protein PLC61_09140, partial [Chitinophagales bacterium]|nr:hypothetical protein [Chitinophagales bacterium]HND46541.1 hypothetical protein [Chitinophagales bacterium]HNJ60173.1 hypothetical protein [Chitinophagales bacterium]